MGALILGLAILAGGNGERDIHPIRTAISAVHNRQHKPILSAIRVVRPRCKNGRCGR